MAPTTGNKTYSTTRTWSHNNNGGNLLVFTCFGESSGPTDTDVTFGGCQADFVCTYGDGFWYGDLWIVRGAPSGSYTIAVSSFHGSGTFRGGIAISLIDAKTAIPTNHNGYSFLSTTPSRDVTSASGCLVIDFIMGRAWTVATPGAGQSTEYALYSSSEAGAGTVTMSWSGLTENRGVQIGVSIEPDDGTTYDWPTIGTVGNSGSGTSSPLSFNNNSEDMLAVMLFDGEASLAVVTGVTFNSVALTQLRSENDGMWLGEIWCLPSPPVGTYNIAVTCSSGTVCKIMAASILNVRRALPTASNVDVYSTYAYGDVTLVADKSQLTLEGIWGRTGNRTPASGQTVVIANEMASRRGSPDYWGRFTCIGDRQASAVVAFLAIEPQVGTPVAFSPFMMV